MHVCIDHRHYKIIFEGMIVRNFGGIWRTSGKFCKAHCIGNIYANIFPQMRARINFLNFFWLETLWKWIISPPIFSPFILFFFIVFRISNFLSGSASYWPVNNQHSQRNGQLLIYYTINEVTPNFFLYEKCWFGFAIFFHEFNEWK